MPGRDKLPATLRRSPAKAQRTWAKTHDSAVREYGEGARAQKLDVHGRSRMSKKELARAIARKQ